MKRPGRLIVLMLVMMCVVGHVSAEDVNDLPEIKIQGKTERERLLNLVPETYQVVLLNQGMAPYVEVAQYTDDEKTEDQLKFLKELGQGQHGVDPNALMMQVVIPDREDEAEKNKEQAEKTEEEEDDDLVITISKLTDRKIYEKSFAMKESRGGLMVGQGPLDDDVFYVRYVGDYVFSSSDELTLLTYVPNYKGAEIQKTFEGSVIENFEAYQVQMVFNWEVIKESLDEEVTLEVEGRQLPVNDIPFLKQFVEKYESFLNDDIQRILVAFNMNEGVLTTEGAVSFRKDSEMHQFLSKKLPPLKVDRLPDFPFYSVMSFNSSFMPMQLAADGLFKDVEKYYTDLKAKGEEPDPALKSQYDIWKMLYQISRSELKTENGQIIMATTEKPSIATALTMINVIQTQDTKELIPSYEKTIPLLRSMMNEAGMANVGLKVSKDVASINGKSVSQLEFTKLPTEAMVFNLHRLYLTTTKAHTFEMWGGDFSFLSKALKTMDGGSTLAQQPVVKEMMAQSLENSFFTMCFNMDQLGTSIAAITRATEGVVPEYPKLSPMYISMAGQEGWLRIRCSIPLKAFKDMEAAKNEAEAQEADEANGAM